MRSGAGGVVLSFLVILTLTSCGKKGPPLPPLIRVPVAPPDFSVVRRGSAITVQFVVPAANSDGSTPADLSRIEVYALTGAATVTPDEILKRGTRIATIQVNQPRAPDESEEQTRRREAARLPEALDQGTTARVVEIVKVDVAADSSDVRSYLAVGMNRRGRRGPFSTEIQIPLTAPPPPPPAPAIAWDEKAITVGWAPAAITADQVVTYNVYRPGDVEMLLSDKPLSETRFTDPQIEWAAERCYVVRTVIDEQNLHLESEASPPTCATISDIFPPAAPHGLTSVPSEAAVDLIWNPNSEADLAGYLVFRAIAPSENLMPIMQTPVPDTTFRDAVPSGARVTYAVQAVDKTGNASGLSERVSETAR